MADLPEKSKEVAEFFGKQDEMSKVYPPDEKQPRFRMVPW